VQGNNACKKKEWQMEKSTVEKHVTKEGQEVRWCKVSGTKDGRDWSGYQVAIQEKNGDLYETKQFLFQKSNLSLFA